MVVTIVPAVARVADHVSSQRTKARAHRDASKVAANETARDTTANRSDERSSAGGGSVGTGGEREQRQQHGK